jgi:hypothetical protein
MLRPITEWRAALPRGRVPDGRWQSPSRTGAAGAAPSNRGWVGGRRSSQRCAISGSRRTEAIRAAGGALSAARPPRRVTLLVSRDDTVTAHRRPAQERAARAAPPATGRGAAAELPASPIHDLRRDDAQFLPDARAARLLHLEGQTERDLARQPDQRALLHARVGGASRRRQACDANQRYEGECEQRPADRSATIGRTVHHRRSLPLRQDAGTHASVGGHRSPSPRTGWSLRIDPSW